VQLRAGQLVELGSSGECGPSLIPLDYEGALTRVRVGSRVYIDDGNVALEVTGMAQGRLRARVVTPGVVKEKKGVNIPDLILAEKGLTAKDRDDFGFGLDNGVRLFAQSFVRSRNDMALLREFAAEKGSSCKLVAKIENRRAVRALDDIMALSDGIMVARGDLGVSLPFYEVPMLQKKILRECRRRRRFGITATQMLESMTEHPTPTRAEVSDVANAVLDGSDFVMLSGETAVGRHPVEAVSAMREIIRFTEKYAGGSAKQRPRARVSGPTPGGIG
jgi:pyruvate kinase